MAPKIPSRKRQFITEGRKLSFTVFVQIPHDTEPYRLMKQPIERFER